MMLIIININIILFYFIIIAIIYKYYFHNYLKSSVLVLYRNTVSSWEYIKLALFLFSYFVNWSKHADFFCHPY